MIEKTEDYLEEALKKLETATRQMQETNGYNIETEKLSFLRELVREQISNENTDHSTSQAR
jgi:hypothetical protein